MTIILCYANRISIVVCQCCLAASLGCTQQRSSESMPTLDAIPYITTSEFSECVSSADLPVLVEFGVPTGCYRCDKMRLQVDRLAKKREGRVQVCRVNLNFEHSLAARFEISVCPTYVAFKGGKEVFRISYPTSSDMLAGSLDDLLASL